MSNTRNQRPIIRKKSYTRSIKLKDCITKVSLPNVATCSPAQREVVKAVLKWGER